MRCKYCINFVMPDKMGNGICFAVCYPDGKFIFPHEEDPACLFAFEPCVSKEIIEEMEL